MSSYIEHMERSDVVLIDKPGGMTSFAVVKEVKRRFRARKVGHAGTLDPMATGLLVIGINSGTKKLHAYVKLSKTYEATIHLGIRTTTGDIEGEVVETKKVTKVDQKKVEQVINQMEGVLALPVPLYSAIKRGGEPLYKKARRGEKIEPPVRSMQINHASVTHVAQRETGCAIDAVFDVGSGTYIRSLAEEVGRRLGYPATLARLRRTRVGSFRLEDAKTLHSVSA